MKYNTLSKTPPFPATAFYPFGEITELKLLPWLTDYRQTFPHLIGLALCEKGLFEITGWTLRPVVKEQYRLALCWKNEAFSQLNNWLPYWTCSESVTQKSGQTGPILIQQTKIENLLGLPFFCWISLTSAANISATVHLFITSDLPHRPDSFPS